MRRMIVVLGFSSLCMVACATGGDKAAASPTAGYPVGTFVDACGTLIESITLTPDSAYVRDGGPEVISRRSGDTTFFVGGVAAFLRQRHGKDSWRYFFAYCHRCSEGKWPQPILWVEVLPIEKHSSAKTYRTAMIPPGLLMCEEADVPERGPR